MNEKSLYEQLHRYGDSDVYPYHMPGHKRRQMGEIPGSILRADITEIDGFDDLHQAEGILRRVQEQANALYGAEETFYLINGSTGGILSAVSAALPQGGHLLMDRNSHRSAYHAAYLRNLKVSYLYPEWMQDFDLFEAVTPAAVERALEEDPDVGAVLLVSPTYEGRIAKIGEIADIVHKRGIPLIVDEAHGAHLGFAEGFAQGSCTQGADLVIHSVHKTLPAMTQTALLHVNGDLIDRDRLRRFLRIYQSSSPSYILMASTEDALKVVREQGKEKFAAFRKNYKELLERLQDCRNFRFVPWKDVEDGRQDIGKLVISTGRKDVSGKWIYDMLRDRYHLQCEMAMGDFCLAMFTMADGEEAYERMCDALREIDGCLPGAADEENAVMPEKIAVCRPKALIPLSEAWDMPCTLMRLDEAAGRPVGEFVNLYPPGVPILAPGEVLTKEMCELIARYRDHDYKVQGIVSQDGAAWIRMVDM